MITRDELEDMVNEMLEEQQRVLDGGSEDE